MKQKFWVPDINQTLRAKSLEIITELAERMRDFSKVKEVISRVTNTSLLDQSSSWSPLELSHGLPSMVVLYAELDRQFPNQKWDEVAHEYLIEIKKVLEHKRPDCSLFSGSTGIAYATWLASKNGERYHNFLEGLDEFVFQEVDRFIGEIAEDSKKKAGINPFHYDVIVGISGIARYFLLRQKAYPYLIKILHLLVSMSEDIKINGELIPGWYIPQYLQMTEDDKREFPQGGFNLGIAHGISGPLALMAIACKQGIEVPGQREAMLRISTWLMAHYHADHTEQTKWPYRLNMDPKAPALHSYMRGSWCYGDLSTARTLFLVGEALHEPTFIQTAQHVFEQFEKVEQEPWGMVTPGFCHGYSGHLQMLVRMNHDNPTLKLAPYIEQAAEFLVQQYDSARFLGFQEMEYKGDQMNLVDRIGLLEGTPSVMLTLLSLNAKKEPRWDQLFLIV